jgi:Tol biopolymer transport system component
MLTAGTKVGAYEILAALGAGGMGEVYRARDARLGRDVALKILPPVFASDPDRLARFEREARTLAALNHPYIAHVHGIEETASVRALVMELVPGRTLDEHARGLPLAERLPLARQIAEGLEAAHELGIVHRDLKPANIKVTDAGVVKILDFGLAKAVGPHDSADAVSPSGATTSPVMTTAGLILGTAAYMAPEQARGKPVDRRADIWAFGVVLYELVTGRRLFDGETASDVVAAVLTRPLELSDLPQELPESVRLLLTRCLERDPRRRMRDIGEARIVLERLSDGGVDDARTSGIHAVAATVPVPARSRWMVALPWAIAAASLLLAGAFILQTLSEPATVASGPSRLSVVLPRGLEFSNANAPSHALAISPDGTLIVLRAAKDGRRALYHRSMANRTIEPIPGTEGGAQPVFGPDGQFVAFVVDQSLKVVGFDGRTPRTLIDDVSPSLTPIWRDDEIIYAAAGRRELRRMPAGGGAFTAFGARDSQYLSIAAVHGSRDILCGVQVGTSRRIEVLDADSGRSAPVVENARLVGYTSSGQVLFERDGVLWAAPFDAAAPRLGTPAAVADGFAYDTALIIPQIAISSSGTLIYAVEAAAARTPTLTWVAASGAQESVGELPPGSEFVDLSPSGRMALLGMNTSPFKVALWDMERKVPTGLQIVDAVTPRWHPDGRRFAIGKSGRLVMIDAETGSETVLVSDKSGLTGAESPSFCADGTVVFSASDFTRKNRDIYALLPGASEPRAIVATDAVEHSPAVSPDGRWLAYVEDTPAPQVYVARFPSGTGRRRLTVHGGNQPLWRRDSRALFYSESPRAATAGRETELRMVPIDASDQLALGTAATLFSLWSPSTPRLAATYNNWGAAFHASADGNRFLMVSRPPLEPLTEIAVVQNWLADAERPPRR